MSSGFDRAAGWYCHDEAGFAGLIGPIWERIAPDGSLVLALATDERHANQAGIAQGGLLVTMADRVMGHQLRRELAGQPVATIQLDTHFLDAGHIGEVIEARATCKRITRRLAFIEGRLSSGDRCLMTANGVWKRLRDADGTAAAEFRTRFMDARD